MGRKPRLGAAAGVHTIVLPLRPAGGDLVLLDRRLEAGFQSYRASVREGRRRLMLCRQSKAYRTACKLPTGTEEQIEVRSAALNAARLAVGLSEQGLQQAAAAGRKESVWIAQHLDAVAVNLLAVRAWETVARALFAGGSVPHLPRREGFRSIDGPPRTSPTSWQGITIRGTYTDLDGTSAAEHTGGWEHYRGPLVMVWNAARGRSRQLVVPIKLANPGTAKGRQQAHALADPAAWRGATVVQTRYRGRVRYELHLLVEKPAFVPAGRYDAAQAADTAQDPGDRVGVDIGVSCAACVSVRAGALHSALLIARTPADIAADRARKQVERRLARAMDRSARATNPGGYGRGSAKKGGRPGRGSRRHGVRLIRSAADKGRRADLAESRRVAAAERERRINAWAITVVSQMGRNLIVERVQIKGWAKLWGHSVSAFAPGLLIAALTREAKKAGGSLLLIETRTTKLSQTCVCGRIEPKPLSVRIHQCPCAELAGARFHRDLFSAHLHTAVRRTELTPAADPDPKPTPVPVPVPVPTTSTTRTVRRKTTVPQFRDVLEVSTARLSLGNVAAAERLLGVAASRKGQLFLAADMPNVTPARGKTQERPGKSGLAAELNSTGGPVRRALGAVATQPRQMLDPADDVTKAAGPDLGPAALGEGFGNSTTAGADGPAAARTSVRQRARNVRVPVHSDG